MTRAEWRARWVTVSGFWIAGALPAPAQDAQQQRPSAPVQTQTIAASEVAALLRRPVGAAEWDGLRLREVFSRIEREGAVFLQVDWKSLQTAGVGEDTLVSVTLRNATLAEALNAVLQDVAAGDALTYQGSGSILRISTRQSFEQRMIVRTYDAEDVAARIPDFRGAPRIAMNPVSGGAGSGSIMSSGSGAGDDSENVTGEDPEGDPALNALRRMIEDVIEPRTWETYGGRGVIRVFDGRLVVRNTVEVHEMLGGRVRLE